VASNIQIVGNINNSSTVSRYNTADTALIVSSTLQGSFDVNTDYIEQYIYDAGGNLLDVNYNYKSFYLPSESYLNSSDGSLPIIEIDPIMDLQNTGYQTGEFKTQYNLFQNIISDSSAGLFIKEISSDRTEIRAASTTISDADLQNQANTLINEIISSQYVVDYLLNFGNNNNFLVINSMLSGSEVFFKLYEPLPSNIDIKSSFWVVKEKVNPYQFDINLDKYIIAPAAPKLRGPNFNIDIPSQNNVATSYQNYNNLINSLQSIKSNSYYKLLNLVTSQSISINVDYTDYSNFSFFGSAKVRLTNFYNKVKQIEDYNSIISIYTPLSGSNPSTQLEITTYKSNITNIISQFDGYESYLYFESSSYAWPKTSSTKPYILQSTSSADTWYQNRLSIAAFYDIQNQNTLTNLTPSFILDDDNNSHYISFINMIGQYFDNIWIYIKAITDVSVANNNPKQGISKDLVYSSLQSLGIKLYNSVGNEEVDLFLVGANTGSTDFDNNFTPTGSFLNNIPKSELLAETYKRIYHNLPLLLKSKGTARGLQTFISTFGITGSILNIKEYGGNTKGQLLKGYNNDKIRIVSNTITGSVLSPLTSLQTQTTTASLFTNEDEHYVDISFSPQNQINTYLSASIAAAAPTWSLDDFIGDPRNLNENSYSDLNRERSYYMSPFTSQYMDYAGFIRLVQFFDNSLFKMLADFVPARASLSTGITIESPILERNKWSYAKPDTTSKIDILDAVYIGPKANTEYTTLYDGLENNKQAYYDGNITGSTYDVYKQWTELNYNPYALSYANAILPAPNGNGNIIIPTSDIYRFNHTDFNALLNNVTASRISLTRKELELIPYSTLKLTSSAYLQDSYEDLRSYQTSRHKGSKLTSQLYNIYTAGDISYGKTAVVDQQTIKFGWVKNIGYNNLNFYDKTQIDLKYLVDPSGSLTELSKHNYNLFEVQNIFKSGTPVIVSISDPLQPSNQRSLDGNKNIWKGGFSYDPILYRELNETLYFIFDNSIGSSQQPIGVKAFCDNFYEYDSYDPKAVDPSTPANNIGGNGIKGYYYRINGSYSDTTGISMASSTYDMTTWPYRTSSYPGLNSGSWGNIPTPDGDRARNGYVYAFDLLDFSNTNAGYNLEPDPNTYQSNGTIHYYKVPRTSTYTISGSFRFGFLGHDYPPHFSPFKVAGIIEKTTTPSNDSSWTYLANTTASNLNSAGSDATFDSTVNGFKFDGDMPNFFNFSLNVNLTSNLTAGEYIRFRFYIIDPYDGFNKISNHWNVMQFKLNEGKQGYFEIYDNNTSVTRYITTGSFGQVPSLFTLGTTNVSNDTLIFNSAATQFFYSSSFSPTAPTNLNYTPIVDNFSLEVGDLIRLGSFDSPASEYHEVRSGSYSSGQYRFVLGSAVTKFDNNNFAILRPKPDETSVILNYKKQPGQTSQTLLIPSNIDLVVKENVANVASQLYTTIGTNNNLGGGNF
jgi:hypothetical protein